MTSATPENVAALRRAVQRLSRRLRSQRPTGGLTDLQLQAMAEIMDHGPITSAGLAARMRTTPQALTRVIASLADEKLVHREPVVTDKRQYLLTISPVGWRALGLDAAPRDAWLAHAMSAQLTDVEQEILVLATRLLDRLAGTDPDPTAETP